MTTSSSRRRPRVVARRRHLWTVAASIVLVCFSGSTKALDATPLGTSKTCVELGLFETSVLGQPGVYCVDKLPCSGAEVNGLTTHFTCPNVGQEDQTGIYLLDQPSCCASIDAQTIGCVSQSLLRSNPNMKCLGPVAVPTSVVVEGISTPTNTPLATPAISTLSVSSAEESSVILTENLLRTVEIKPVPTPSPVVTRPVTSPSPAVTSRRRSTRPPTSKPTTPIPAPSPASSSGSNDGSPVVTPPVTSPSPPVTSKRPRRTRPPTSKPTTPIPAPSPASGASSSGSSDGSSSSSFDRAVDVGDGDEVAGEEKGETESKPIGKGIDASTIEPIEDELNATTNGNSKDQNSSSTVNNNNSSNGGILSGNTVVFVAVGVALTIAVIGAAWLFRRKTSGTATGTTIAGRSYSLMQDRGALTPDMGAPSAQYQMAMNLTPRELEEVQL